MSILDLITYVTPTLLFLGIMIIPKYSFVTNLILLLDSEKEKLSLREHVSCLIPLVNSGTLRKHLYGSSGYTIFVNIFIVVVFIAFLIQRQFFFSSIEVNIIFTSLLLFNIFVILAHEGIIALGCANLFQAKWYIKAMSLLIPVISYGFILSSAKLVLRETQDERVGVFDGGKLEDA